MDTRTKTEEKQDSALQKIDDDKYLIKVDQVASDKSYREAIIYNLVNKLNILDELNFKYKEKLNEVETFPAWIKYYVHLKYLLPSLAVIITAMKYKKGMAVVCASTLVNEFAKTIKIKRLDGEKTRKYEEHAANYSYLMDLYVKNVTIAQMLKYMLGVKISQDMVNWRRFAERDDLMHDYLLGTYY